MTGQDIASGSETCLKRGCQMVVVTLGKGIIYRNIAAAAYIRDTGKEYIIPSSQKNTAESVDTTGAGDAFATGFLYGLLNKKHPDECGRLGDTTARFSITSPGARQGLPTANELSRRYRELY